MRAIAAAVAEGRIRPEEIDEATVAAHLYTAGMPDPDLLIRTANEMLKRGIRVAAAYSMN